MKINIMGFMTAVIVLLCIINNGYAYAGLTNSAPVLLSRESYMALQTNIPPELVSAEVKTLEAAGSMAFRSYCEMSKHNLSAQDSFGPFGSLAAVDFGSFVKKGQWIWEWNISESLFGGVPVKTNAISKTGFDRVLGKLKSGIWINAHSGELAYVAGEHAEKKKPVAITAEQIGTNRVERVAAVVYARTHDVQIPENVFVMQRHMMLDSNVENFAKREDIVREIRFYNDPDEVPPKLYGIVWAKVSDKETKFYFPTP